MIVSCRSPKAAEEREAARLEKLKTSEATHFEALLKQQQVRPPSLFVEPTSDDDVNPIVPVPVADGARTAGNDAKESGRRRTFGKGAGEAGG